MQITAKPWQNTNKKKPESSDIGQNPRPLKSERIKTCWYSPKIDVVNIQLFAAQIKGTCNLCLQTLVRKTRSLCSTLEKNRKSVFNELIKVLLTTTTFRFYVCLIFSFQVKEKDTLRRTAKLRIRREFIEANLLNMDNFVPSWIIVSKARRHRIHP